MKGLFIGSGIVAGVAYAALTWSPATKSPIIPPAPPSSTVVQSVVEPVPDPTPPVAQPSTPTPEPAAQAQETPRVEMPTAPVQARQGSTQPAEPMPQHRRPPPPADNQIGQVNRPVANGFTAGLNRQEIQSLEGGGRAPPSAAWRELGPPPRAMPATTVRSQKEY